MEGLYASAPPGFLNREMFEQLLDIEMEDPGFLKEIIETWVSQVTSKLETLQNYCNLRNMIGISNVGHLLKGSSAALGLSAIASTFERIQHLGKEQESLDNIQKEIHLAHAQFQIAKELLSKTLDLIIF